MFNIQKVEKQIDGKVLSLETGRIARQAHGAAELRDRPHRSTGPRRCDRSDGRNNGVGCGCHRSAAF
ncbi:MAG: hypothetical protein ACYTEU_05125 [Planctomycetota bacterium]